MGRTLARRWVWGVGLLVLCGGAGLAVGIRQSRPDTTHIPLYPQARNLQDREGAALRAGYASTPGVLVPAREITYEVADGPEPVMDFYLRQLPAGNWQYITNPLSDTGDHQYYPRPCERWGWPAADLHALTISVCTDPPRFFDGRPAQEEGPTQVHIELFAEPVEQIATATLPPTLPWTPPPPTVPAALATPPGIH